ncbi:DMT family transporter [Pseudogulbenkiania sp. MAI-1]|uniref:DMT family transporter n=1 Tax=Pseudogulbenkiania sp. MAI-1 TaxID=990370 RepID=UPI000A0270D6|nr:DMT family transporter [Pseudogulbenkiania sp. MAI-1]
MDTRKPLDLLAVSIMGVLCFIWALQQVALKFTANDISPMLQIALRAGIATILVAITMRIKGESITFRDGTFYPGILTGTLFALEFLLIAEALRLTSASHVVVFLYTAPVFSALGLHWRIPEEKLQSLQWAGILLALAGIALTFLFRAENKLSILTINPSDTLLGDGLALLGGAAWGVATIAVRCSSLAGASACKTSIYYLTITFVVLLSAAFYSGQAKFNNNAVVWISLAFQAIIVSFVSFFGWLWLLKKYLASSLGAFSFLTPMLGVVLGNFLLNEPIESSFLLGAILVLTGISLVIGHNYLAKFFNSRNSLY